MVLALNRANSLAGWLVARVLGLVREGNWTTTDFAFDVLSLQALFLVFFGRAMLTSGTPSIQLFGSLAVLWATITK